MQKRKSPSFFASLFGRAETNKSTPRKAADTVARPFQAISIHPGTVCCRSAKNLDKHRFLLKKEALQLPLAECTMAASCKCRYVKHNDRRSDARRDSEFGFKQTLFLAEERRHAKGRRKND